MDNAKTHDEDIAARLRKRERSIVIVCVLIVGGMTGMAYAAVPLYDMFCRVTGYGGTTQVAERSSDVILDREMTIRFDAGVAKGMPWDFAPKERRVTVRVGENRLAYYAAHNPTDRTITGTATYNVTPQKAGIYFNKIACFCFTEQVLAAGESVDMPVTFFVDPALADDPEMDDVKTITLSYTFFVKDEPEAVVASK